MYNKKNLFINSRLNEYDSEWVKFKKKFDFFCSCFVRLN